MHDKWDSKYIILIRSSTSILPCVRAAKALVRLDGCEVSPEPSLKTCAIGISI